MVSPKIKFVFIFFILIIITGILALSTWQFAKSRSRAAIKHHKIVRLSHILASHWDVEIVIEKVASYRKGDIDNFDAVFLINQNYDKQIPDDLIQDLANSGDKEIIWSGFGSEKLLSSLQFTGETVQIDPDQFHSVAYKGLEFSIQSWHILNHRKWPAIEGITALASIIGANRQQTPFIIDIHDRYLIVPLDIISYYMVEDVSLVFFDVLHNSFGHHHPAKKKALLRLEDISPIYGRHIKPLQIVYDYLKGEKIPMHLALIPRFIDKSQNIDIKIGDVRNFLNLMLTMNEEGLATFIQHGYTHQTGDEVSGDGFEFWDQKNNKPIRNDSRDYVLDRVKQAQLIMAKNGLPIPDIFETPHYSLSDLDDETLNAVYPCRYEHIKKTGVLPFTAKIDGTIYFPENLGYISNGLDDIIQMKELLKKLSAFEDPLPSMFWQPWRDVEEIKKLTNMIRDAGYEFVSVYDLVESNGNKQYVLKDRNRISHEQIKKVLIITVL